jgi:glycopeptide antibiotics resistance protein
LILASVKNLSALGAVTVHDKVNHLVAFLALSVVFEMSYPTLHSVFKVYFLLSFSVSIEILQSFIPWRTAEFLDVVAGGVGVLLFYVGCFGLDWIRSCFGEKTPS